jgi:foldase protein PrsA
MPRNTLWKPTALAAVSLCVLAGCQSGDRQVVATVNGKNITKDQLYDRMLLTQSSGQGGMPQPAGAAALQSLAQEQMILDLAAKRGVTPTKEEVESMLLLARTQNPEEFNRPGVNEELIRRNASLRLAVQKLMGGKANLSDKELDEYYKKNPQQYDFPKRVQYSQFSVESETKARELVNVLQKAPQNFATIARTNASKSDFIGQQGGKSPFGWVPVDSAPANPQFGGPPAPVLAALKTMKKDEVRGPIKVGEKQFLIVKLDDVREAQKLTMEQIRPMLRVNAQMEKVMGNPAEARKVQDEIMKEMGNPKITTTIQQLKQYVETPAGAPTTPGGAVAGGPQVGTG